MLPKRFNLNLISKFRTELMGLSALGIIACHAAPNGVYLPSPLYQLAAFGQLGVIIFFFLSGMGVFYSLSQFEGSVWKWYKRRFLRIGIPYSLLAIPFFIFAQFRNRGG